MRRPRIAIPEIDQNVKNYTSAAYAAGLEPIVISVQTEQVQQMHQQEYLDYSEFHAEGYDGLLLPGGWDIDPGRYGAVNRGCFNIREDLDELQFAMLDVFVRQKKPVLGICRGHQVINVYFGGTLVQNIATAFRHMVDAGKKDRVHSCKAAEGSWLADLYGMHFFHNSAHHQAVERIGEGLEADGYCPQDDMIEALHHKTLPVFGVQWHPERMCLDLERDDTVNGLEVLQFFCRICGGHPEAFADLETNRMMRDGMGL